MSAAYALPASIVARTIAESRDFLFMSFPHAVWLSNCPRKQKYARHLIRWPAVWMQAVDEEYCMRRAGWLIERDCRLFGQFLAGLPKKTPRLHRRGENLTQG